MAKNTRQRKISDSDKDVIEKHSLFGRIHSRFEQAKRNAESNKSRPIFCIVGYNYERVEISGFHSIDGINYVPNGWMVATRDRIEKLLGNFNNELAMPISFVEPGNIIALGYKNDVEVAWFRPAKIEKLSIPEHYNKQKMYWVPPMIFMYKEKNVYACSYLGDSAPTKENKLYKAPFANWLNDEFKACLGSAQPKRSEISSVAEIINAYEKAFMKATFTAVIKDPDEYYPNVSPAATKEEVFSFWEKSLVPLKVKLDQWIQIK